MTECAPMIMTVSPLCKAAQLLSELPVDGDKSRSAYLREAASRIKHEFGRNILPLSFCSANGDIRLPLPAQRYGAKDSTKPLGLTWTSHAKVHCTCSPVGLCGSLARRHRGELGEEAREH